MQNAEPNPSPLAVRISTSAVACFPDSTNALPSSTANAQHARSANIAPTQGASFGGPCDMHASLIFNMVQLNADKTVSSGAKDRKNFPAQPFTARASPPTVSERTASETFSRLVTPGAGLRWRASWTSVGRFGD